MLIEKLSDELQKLRVLARNATLRGDLRGSMDQRRVAQMVRVFHQPIGFMRQSTGKMASDVLAERMVLGIGPLLGKLIAQSGYRFGCGLRVRCCLLWRLL